MWAFCYMHVLFATATLLLAQSSSNQPFANVSFPPLTSENILKSYDTTLEVIPLNNDTELNSTIFNETAHTFYSTDPSLQGFVDLTFQTTGTLSFRVRYKVTYNYTVLNNSVGGRDQGISETIGNLTYVAAGLQDASSEFSSIYSVSNSTSSFTFAGVSVCDASLCDGIGLYVMCVEVQDGVTVACNSTCYSPYCFNEGYCIHTSPIEKPMCSCHSSSDWWYVGDRCESLLAVWMVVVFFVIVFIILLLIPLITWLCVRSIDQRLLKEKEKEEKKLMKAATKEREKENKKNSKLNNTSNLNNEINTPDTTNQNGGTVVQGTAGSTVEAAPPTSNDSFDDTTSASSRTSVSTRNHSASEPDSNPVRSEPGDLHGPIYSVATDVQSPRQRISSVSSSSVSSSSDDAEEASRHNQPPEYTDPPVYSSVQHSYRNPDTPLVTTV